MVVYGSEKEICSWMDLVRLVRWNFPGLETEESINEHRQTVLSFMKNREAICVKDDEKVIGVLLYSKEYNMICCLAVHPDYRRKGIGNELLKIALKNLNKHKEVTVTTFREEDEKGKAPRSLYKKFGFVEDELIEEFGYPNQKFVLHP